MEEIVKSYNTPPPNYDLNLHATNGFSHKPSPAQIISYLVIIASITIYFTSVLPTLNIIILLILYIIFGTLMIISAGWATAIDPTDRVVYYFKWTRINHNISFNADYDKILFCEFCDSYCWANSRHCRTCNRCTSQFDHHCMWFNNCVGQYNYKHFFVSIIATFLYCTVLIVHVVLASFKINLSQKNQLIKIIFTWIIGLLLVIFAFLILNLIILHIYLGKTNQTTYQFLQKRKKEQQLQMKQRQNQQLSLKQKSTKSSTLNQILPVKSQNQRFQHVDIVCEDSLANTKIVVIHNEKDVDNDEKINPTHKRRKSKVIIEQRLQNQIQKQLDRQTYANNQPQPQSRQSLEQSIKSIPQFLKKNRSIKLLLSDNESISPGKKKLQPISTQNILF